MNIVIFGLTISSSWGNGHATLWRGLCKALGRLGHEVLFFERDVPYYAENRDAREPAGCKLILYSRWDEVRARARRELDRADVGMVTSYCPDALAAGELVLSSSAGRRVFYDLDTPVTLSRLDAGETVDYIGPDGLAHYDLVLSYTGGRALQELQDRLHARQAVPLYGSVDPEAHYPVAASEAYRADFSYLGTYAADRQRALETLFIEPARRRSDLKFLIGGAMYPAEFPWTPNIFFVRHLPPPEHPVFYCSSRLTLNVTRSAMARMGYCPSGRLFEAAACGTAILSDRWEGLDRFFEPGREILLADTTEQAMAALELSSSELGNIGRAARERGLAEHTAAHRARELEQIFSRSLQHHTPSSVAPS